MHKFIVNAILILASMSITGCGQDTEYRRENWYASAVWSPDGTQVAYFRRYIEYEHSKPKISFFIGEETVTNNPIRQRLFLCLNDKLGKSEGVLIEIQNLPPLEKEKIPNIYMAIAWRGQEIYYGVGQRAVFSTGVRRISLQNRRDEILDPSFEAIVALGQQIGPRVFDGLELYGGGGGPYGYFGNQTIYLFDHNLRKVAVYLHDPLSPKPPYVPPYSVTGR